MGRALRILMISEDFLPCIGGISHHVVSLSAALKRSGNDVRILARAPHGHVPDKDELGGLDATCVPTMRTGSGWTRKTRHLGFIIRGSRSLDKILQEFRPDIAHFHGLWSDSVLAARARRAGGVRLVFTNHSSKFIECHSSGLTRNLLKAWLTVPDACISPSRELAEKYRGMFKDVATTYIPNGVDLDQFGVSCLMPGARKALGLPENVKIAVCPRRLCHKNGVQHLLEAIPLVPEVYRPVFAIAGDGPMRRELEDTAARLGVSAYVLFLGAVSYKEMPALYAASDICVMPSLMEAVSLAALESLASGLPVVASAVGGLVDLLAGKSAGILVPAGKPAELAEAITDLMADGERMREAGLAARELARAYSWDGVARQTEEVYDALARGLSLPAPPRF